MTWLAGIDGCRGGWIVAFRKAGTRGFDLRVIDTIADIKTQKIRPGVVCIDVPIGLLEHAARGGRECDRKARARLGQPKASSVFSPPVRPALSAGSYEEALRRNRASSKEGIGISRQAYGIFGKIAEVDAFMTAQRQRTTVEVHPEVTFCALNRGRPFSESKKSKDGLKRRIQVLTRLYGPSVAELVEAHRSSLVARDDIVDAIGLELQRDVVQAYGTSSGATLMARLSPCTFFDHLIRKSQWRRSSSSSAYTVPFNHAPRLD